MEGKPTQEDNGETTKKRCLSTQQFEEFPSSQQKNRHSLCLGELDRKLDRFIPNRANLNNSYSYFLLQQSEAERAAKKAEDSSILYQKIGELNLGAYRSLLDDAFDVNESSVIPIFPVKKKRKKSIEALWPVSPRSKPSISPSTAILDLPHLNEHFHLNLIDWGATDYIAAALNRSVYLYYAPTHKTEKINMLSWGTAVKWSPDGSKLAIAMKHGYLQIWDLKSAKIIHATLSSCPNKLCSVAVIEWHPFKDFLVTGCTSGLVKIHSTDLKEIHIILDAHTKSVVSLAFNCDGTYLASSSMDGYFLVFCWEDLQTRYYTLRVSLGNPIRALAWHPWKAPLLCVGSLKGCLNLWDVSRSKNRCIAQSSPKTKKGTHHFLFCLTFNKISGELVTSHLLQESLDTDDWGVTQINVLSSFDKLVDRMVGHVGSVLYLKWNPDGTQLATAGIDETLQLWNFLPKQEKKQSARKSFGGMTEYSCTFNSFHIR